MKAELMNKLSSKISKVKFVVGKHSPEILLVAGITGTVVSTIMACRATAKVKPILDETKQKVDKIHETASKEENKELYSEKDANKDLILTYAKTGVDLAKVYAPAVTIGVASVTSILASHNILQKRNAALAVAYATVDNSFKDYRNKVVERFGEKVDKELKYGLKAQKIETVETDETGKEKKVKKTVEVSELSEFSDYAVYFDKEHFAFATGIIEHDLTTLKKMQRFVNDQFVIKKTFITLNEGMLDALGANEDNPDIKRLKSAGMVVGWKWDPNSDISDNVILYGIYESYRTDENGRVVPCIILDPNVDGEIYSRVKADLNK